MSNEKFVQQRAYVYAPSPEEIRQMENRRRKMEDKRICGEDEFFSITEEDDDTRGVVIIDILGE